MYINLYILENNNDLFAAAPKPFNDKSGSYKYFLNFENFTPLK